jgi:hypothetical protein
MVMTMVRTVVQFAAVALLLLPSNQQPASTAESVQLTRYGNKVDIAIGGRPFSTYYFDPAQAKPYLQPLRSAKGTVVSRGFPIGNDVPEQHRKDQSLEPHQRDLYFAHGNINGLNFWAEEAFSHFYGQEELPFGRTVFQRLESAKSGKEAGSLLAQFTLEGPGGKIIGGETQQFTFSGDATTRTIDCEFTLRADHGPLTIHDTKEGTFAIRVAPELNSPPGQMVNSRGGEGEPQIWGKPADWVNYDGTIGGDQVGIAIFDSPANFRHPTTWHARGYGLFSVNPFALRAFTGDPKQDGGHTVADGSRLTLRYRVLIHTGTHKDAGIAEAYRQYAKEQPARGGQ